MGHHLQQLAAKSGLARGKGIAAHTSGLPSQGNYFVASRLMWACTPGTWIPPLFPCSMLAHCSANTSGSGLHGRVKPAACDKLLGVRCTQAHKMTPDSSLLEHNQARLGRTASI